MSRAPKGFLLLETMIAIALIGLIASGALFALTMVNRHAVIGRLYTGAANELQEQVDNVLYDGPFKPRAAKIPPVLTVGTSTKTVPIYVDPTAAVPSVQGTMTTVVENLGLSQNGQDLNVFKASITLTYAYRGKTYTQTTDVLRSPDS